MNITLKNGDKLEVAEGADCAAAAKAISEGLARAAVAAKVNGELVDLSTALKEGDSLEIVTLKDKEGLHVYRHTCAHVLAQAIKNIFPTCEARHRARHRQRVLLRHRLQDAHHDGGLCQDRGGDEEDHQEQSAHRALYAAPRRRRSRS